MNDRILLKKRKKALKQVPNMQECIRGSAVVMNRSCGKPNCRCQKGSKHKAVYLSQSHKGKTRMVYIPADNTEKLCKYIKNYQKAKTALNTISDINIRLLVKKGKKNGNKEALRKTPKA